SRLRSQVSPMGTWIIMGIDEVDFRETRKGRFHLFARVRLEPFHIGLKNHFDSGTGDALAETAVPILPWGRSHQALQLDNFAFTAKLLHDPLPRSAADLLVIGADKAGIFVTE